MVCCGRSKLNLIVCPVSNIRFGLMLFFFSGGNVLFVILNRAKVEGHLKVLLVGFLLYFGK